MTVRIRKHLDSETLHLPELRPLIGKTVEIVVNEDSTAPVEPGDYSALRDLLNRDVIDPDAYKRLRAGSMT